MTPGITYIAASGDNPGVDYPAASPYVLSVGGTTLNLDGSGNYSSETAWPDSGGGYSQYEAEPSYQESVQQTGERSTPDVAFDGDPNTGRRGLRDPTHGQGHWQQQTPQGSWQVVGGTSLGARSWAGIIAIVDQGRALAGQASLSGATQTLPSLYDLPADFNSVTASQSGGEWRHFPWGGFGGWSDDFGIPSGTTTMAGSTANTQTGLGTPIGTVLVDNLEASTTDRARDHFESDAHAAPRPRRPHRRPAQLLRAVPSTTITTSVPPIRPSEPRSTRRPPTASGSSHRNPTTQRTSSTRTITTRPDPIDAGDLSIGLTDIALAQAETRPASIVRFLRVFSRTAAFASSLRCVYTE